MQTLLGGLQKILLNIINPSNAKLNKFIFSPAQSCVSLPRPITSCELKLRIFVFIFDQTFANLEV